ncbi:MAG: hypothetical protein U0930_22155 [Pirellulales bacterium]
MNCLSIAVMLLVFLPESDTIAISNAYEVDGKPMRFELWDSHTKSSMNWPEMIRIHHLRLVMRLKKAEKYLNHTSEKNNSRPVLGR